MDLCKILSWIIRGCRNLDKRLWVFRYIKNSKPSVCLLQETYVLEEDLGTLETNWNEGQRFINPGSSRSAGQTFLVKI